MSIQFAGGTIIDTTLTQAAGTRAELAQWIRDQLVAAGWTSSGSATDYQVTSATTTGGALQCRVRVYDPGSGNCARLKWSNPGGTKTQTSDMFLLPAIGKVWRIVANKFQFFVYTPGTSAAREFAAGGVPYLPTSLQGVITECIWAVSNAGGDTITVIPASFRTRLDHGNNTGASSANVWALCNGNMWEVSGAVAMNANGQMLLTVPSQSIISNVTGGYRWHDDSLLVAEPLIAWGLTAVGDEPKIRGQLWDAIYVSDTFADTTITLAAHNYRSITNSNAGVASNAVRGTLFVAIT